MSKYGVGDGIRTRDVQIHSLALYQLSYTHHNCGLPCRLLSYLCNIGGEGCQLIGRSGDRVNKRLIG